jgi:ELWxxDGT repeat protein
MSGSTLPILTDINKTTKDSNPAPAAELGGHVIFAAENTSVGRELFIADPNSPNGARVLADVNPGAGASNPSSITAIGSRVLFWGKDQAAGSPKLFSCDSSGTFQSISSIVPVAGAASNIVLLNGRAYFFGSDGQSTGIFTTDGTTAGTSLAVAAPWVDDLVPFNGSLLYSLGTSQFSTRTLWSLDTNNIASQISPDGIVVRAPLIPLGDTLLFTGNNDPWRTDGTPTGTRQVADLLGTNTAQVTKAVRLDNGTIIFTVGSQNALFSLNPDGSTTGPLGTTLNGGPSAIVAVGNKAFFGLTDSSRGSLFVTDGTPYGTQLVKRIGPTSNFYSPNPTQLTALGNKLIFNASDGITGLELWISDGTANGTALLKDINPGPGDSNPEAGPDSNGNGRMMFIGSDGFAYFGADDGQTGMELWRSDATAAGTTRVADANAASLDAIWANMPSSEGYFAIPQNGVELNGKTYFAADDGAHGRELWATDGTSAGTYMVADVFPGAASSDPVGIISFDGEIFFAATATYGTGSTNAVFKTDGTAQGTVRISSTSGYYSARGFGNEQVLLPFQGKLAFLGYQPNAGTSIWMTNGTSAGTYPAGSVISTTTADPQHLTVSGGYIYFSVNTGGSLDSLCRHDGTNWSVVAANCHPMQLADINGHLFFSYNPSSPSGGQLWVTDASGARQISGVKTVYDIEQLGSEAIISAIDPQNRYALYRSDGTIAGTSEFFDGTGINSPMSDMRAVGNLVWGFAGTATTGYAEPWVTDGTAAGTHMVTDLNPGAASSFISGYPNPYHYPFFTSGPDGFVYFQATTAANGTELFRSDGTAAGTRLVCDFIPGPGDSLPGPFLEAGGNLYIAADDPTYGREWHRLSADDIDPLYVTSHAFPMRGALAATITFSEDVSGSLDADDISIVNLTTGQPLAQSMWTLTLAGGNGSGTIANIGLADVAPDGQYQIRIESDGVSDVAGHPLLTDFAAEFFLVSGSSADDAFHLLNGNIFKNKASGSTPTFTVSAQAERVWIRGMGGSDSLDLSNFGIPTVFDGGGGDDTLYVYRSTLMLPTTQHLTSLTLDGAMVSLPSNGNILLVADALSIDTSSRLDLADNDLIVRGRAIGSWNASTSAYDGITGLIGSGVIRSSLAQPGDTALGTATAGDLLGITGAQTALWDGQAVNPSDVLVKLTYAGDANLDGKINIDDYGRIDSHVGQSGIVFGWYSGDFNFDGKINIDDYGLIDSVIGAQGPVL